MPQVVKTQPTGAFTTGGQSTGAVIFDRPQYDPTTIALKVADDLDTWSKERAAEQDKARKEISELTKDLDFTVEKGKGMLPSVAAAFESQREDAIKAGMEAEKIGYKSGVGSPEFIEAKTKLNMAKNRMLRTYNDGVAGFEMVKQYANKEYDKQKTDLEQVPVKLAKTLAIPYLNPNGEVNKDWESSVMGLQAPPRLPTMEEDVMENLQDAEKAGALKPETVKFEKTTIDPVSGDAIQIEKTTTMPDAKAKLMAESHLADPRKSNRVKGVWADMESRVDANGKNIDPTYLYYTNEAAKTGDNPMALWLSQKYKGYAVDREQRNSLGMPYASKKELDLKYGREEDRDLAAPLLEKADAMIQGAPQYLSVGEDFYGNKVPKIEELKGMNLGKTNIGDKTVPDEVLDNYYVKGTPNDRFGVIYVMTNSSYSNEYKRVSEKFIEENPEKKDDEIPQSYLMDNMQKKNLYQPIGNTTQLFNKMLANIEDPEKKQKMLKGADALAKELGASGGGGTYKTGGFYKPKATGDIIKKEIISSQGKKEEPAKAGEVKVTQTPAEKKTTVKVDYSKMPKSSDGKWYWDGKAWQAIK